MDDCGNPMTHFGGCTNFSIFRSLVSSCTTPNNVAIVRRRQAYVMNIMDDEFSLQLYRNLTDVFTYPMHSIHLYVICVDGLEEDVVTVLLIDARCECFIVYLKVDRSLFRYCTVSQRRGSRFFTCRYTVSHNS